MEEPPVMQNTPPGSGAPSRRLYAFLALAVLLFLALVFWFTRNFAESREKAVAVATATRITNEAPVPTNTPPPAPPAPPEPVPPPPSPPQPRDFVGKWTGKWDNTWTVQLTISLDPATGQLSSLYEWEERYGEPLRQSRGNAILNGDVVYIGAIELTLSPTNKNRAVAVGKFRNQRTAKMVRETP
jgi:hypothetical protein